MKTKNRMRVIYYRDPSDEYCPVCDGGGYCRKLGGYHNGYCLEYQIFQCNDCRTKFKVIY